MSFNVNVGGGRASTGGCGSIFGMLFGIILIPLGFFLVYYGEAKLVNHGVVFARTAMVTPEQAATATGLVKFRGKPAGDFIKAKRFSKPVVYWHTSLEQYESERDSDGRVEYDWNTKSSDKQWASFSVGGIRIVADKANVVGERTVFQGVRRSSGEDFDPSKVDRSPQVGDQRFTVEVIEAGPELIVLGQVADKVCQGGSTFVVSALDEAGTEAALRLEYKILYWVLKGGAVFAMWIGLIAFFGPLMALVGWIPLIGERLSCGLAFGALLFAAIMVGVVTVAVKLFWVIVAVVVVALAAVVWRGVKSPRQRPTALPPPPIAPVGPPAPPPPPSG